MDAESGYLGVNPFISLRERIQILLLLDGGEEHGVCGEVEEKLERLSRLYTECVSIGGVCKIAETGT